MLVTALSPVIGYDKASKIAHYAMDNDLTLKAAALKLGFVTEGQFDRVVDPAKMVEPYVAGALVRALKPMPVRLAAPAVAANSRRVIPCANPFPPLFGDVTES
jgi:hypothetical protein